MKRSAIVLVAMLGACLGISSMARAAAALESGAATSAKPTAKDPVKRQMQIAADPDGITDFQFTLKYDPRILHVAREEGNYLIDKMNGYELGLRNPTEGDLPFYVDQELGLVTVRGYWPEIFQEGPGGVGIAAIQSPFVPTGHVDVFSVVFELNEGLPIDTYFKVDSIGAERVNSPLGQNDFMTPGQYNPQTGRLEFGTPYSWEQIEPATTGLVTIAVPTPLAAQGVVMPMALLLLRRKRQLAA